MKKIPCFALIATSLFLPLWTNAEDPAKARLIDYQLIAPSKNKKAMEAYQTGTGWLHKGQYAEAEKYLLEAVQEDPAFVDAMDHLGIIYRRTGKPVKAEEWYRKSIATLPTNPVPYQNLGLLYSLQKKWKDSVVMYQKSIDLNPQDPEGYYGIGSVYVDQNQFAEAEKYLNSAIEKYLLLNSPIVADAYYLKALCQCHQSQFQEALQTIELGLKIQPDDPNLTNLKKICKSQQPRK